MKNFTFLIIFTLLSPAWALADADDGYKTPKEAIQAFLAPLKKGKDGIKDSMKASGSLNGETEEDSELAQTLKADMKEQGKVVKYKETDSYSRLNGNMQKFTYEIQYSSGKKREVTFTILRPQANGGYHIMRMQAE